MVRCDEIGTFVFSLPGLTDHTNDIVFAFARPALMIGDDVRVKDEYRPHSGNLFDGVIATIGSMGLTVTCKAGKREPVAAYQLEVVTHRLRPQLVHTISTLNRIPMPVEWEEDTSEDF